MGLTISGLTVMGLTMELTLINLIELLELVCTFFRLDFRRLPGPVFDPPR